MNTILLPATAMMLLTFLVWLYMFVRRVVASKVHKLDPQGMQTPEQLTSLYDDSVNAIGNCFKNQFELPVVFYGICLFIAVTGLVDDSFVYLAWAFVVMRVLQAIVHCSYNRVMHRFLAYTAGSIVLWIMVIRFTLMIA